MRLVFLGDIVGRSGREAVLRHLPLIREHLAPDLIVANGENAAGTVTVSGAVAADAVRQAVEGAGFEFRGPV